MVRAVVLAILSGSLLLGLASFDAEVLSLATLSGCHLIHTVVKLLWPFVVFYLLLPLCKLRHRATNRPVTQKVGQFTAKYSTAKLSPITSDNVTLA